MERVVVIVAALGAVPCLLEERLTAGTIGEGDKVGLLRGVLQGKNIARKVAALGQLSGCRDARFGETSESGLVGGGVGGGLRGSEDFGDEGVGKGGGTLR